MANCEVIHGHSERSGLVAIRVTAYVGTEWAQFLSIWRSQPLILNKGTRMKCTGWQRVYYLTLTSLSFVLPGCATQEAPRTEVTQAFNLVDQRPDEENSTEWLSRNTSSCDFTLRQIGDEATSPDRFTVLRASLDSTLHDRLLGKTLNVMHYAIYINNWDRDRGPVFSMNGGFIGSVIQEVRDRHTSHRCQEEMTAQGRLEPADLQTHRSPVIVEITLVLDGKTHSVRSLLTPHQEISLKPEDRETAAAIHSAMDKAIQQLIAELLIA